MFHDSRTASTSHRRARASRRLTRLAACLAVTLALTACDEAQIEDSHPLVGSWIDGFGFEHQITKETWESAGSTWAILEVDTAGEVLFAQNGASNAFAAELYSRFDWTFDDAGDLYFCQSAFDATSLDAARATVRADDTNLETGCGGFSWSSLSPY